MKIVKKTVNAKLVYSITLLTLITCLFALTPNIQASQTNNNKQMIQTPKDNFRPKNTDDRLLMQCPLYVAPLLIDLGNDGFNLSKKGEGAFFAFEINNVFRYSQWVAKGTNDAFIVIDHNFNTVVDDFRDLIGNGEVRYGPDFKVEGYAPHGFVDLAQYDDARRGGNHDGMLSVDDEIWSILKLWVDSNGDGVSSQHELMPLSKSELTSIDITYYNKRLETDEAGNVFKFWSSAQGKEQYPIADVLFKTIDLSKRHLNQ